MGFLLCLLIVLVLAFLVSTEERYPCKRDRGWDQTPDDPDSIFVGTQKRR